MNIFEFKTNPDYKIVNQFIDNHTGFKHKSTLIRRGYEIFSTSIQYYNSPWERFTYENSMIKLIHNIIDYDLENEKQYQGIKRLTKEKKAELLKTEKFQIYNKLLEEIYNYGD